LLPKPRRNYRNLKSEPHDSRNTGGAKFRLPKLRQKASASNYALRLEDHYSRKFGQVVTPIAILKTLAIITSDFKKNWRLWVLNVAPSRHLKSKTNEEQALLFGRRKLVYLGSDCTIHGLYRDYESGRKIDRKCLFVNDTTLLLASKAKQAKSRLIDAFSELGSEGRYIYRDFQKSFEIKAKFSLVANITPHSFMVNRERLLGNTIVERCLVVYHALTEEEMSEANLNRNQRDAMKMEKFKPCLREEDVKVSKSDLVRFNEYARRWRFLGAYSSSSSLFDMIKSIAIAYAILSGNRRITKAEYRYLDMLEPHLQNPDESVKLTILQLAHQGRSIKDICLVLNKDYEKYRPFVSRTISEYRQKGLLPWRRDAWSEANSDGRRPSMAL
jgi:hypothetical protein